MRKFKVLIFILIGSTLWLFPAGNVMINLSGNYLNTKSASRNEGILFPELKISYNASRDFHVWSSFSYLDVVYRCYSSTSIGHIFSIGIGYHTETQKNPCYMVETGICKIVLMEKNPEKDAGDSLLGFQMNGIIVSSPDEKIFGGLSIGFMTAFNLLPSQDKFSGLKVGLIIGWKL